MKQSRLTILLIMLMCTISNKMYAYDIAVKNSEGIILYYNWINNHSELQLTCEAISSWASSYGYLSFKSQSLTIPEFINYQDQQYRVTSIASETFFNCNGLTSVTIPKSVTSIGNDAFKECTELTSVYISDIKAWCGISFSNFSSNPLYYAHHLFLNNTLITELVIPDSVTSIRNYAFSGCTGLVSVIIPNSVTKIGNYAFYNTCIRSLTIGSGVQSIGTSAFGFVSSKGIKPIKTIWLTNTPPTNYNYADGHINYVANNLYTSLSNKYVYPFLSSIFEVDGIKYVPVSPSDRTCVALDCIYDISTESVHINSTVNYKGVSMKVKNINAYTCFSNNHIKDIVLINEGAIGDYAFYDCDAIVSVNASNNGNIGTNAFYDCDSIINIDLSNNGSIGQQAFYSCNSLKTAKLQNKGIIDNQAFAECVSLETCTFGNKVTCLNNSSFQNCSKLQQIVIPDSIKQIGEYVFSGCSSMKSAIIGNGVKNISQYAFSGCKGLQTVIVGNGTETISQYAFSGCSSLTNIEIGLHVKQINTYAFQNCSSLPQIEIPASVTSISDYTFSGCTNLATVLIANRNSKLKLGSNGSSPLFSSCQLDSVYIGGDITYNTSSNYGYSPFYRNTSLRTIHITDKETEISPNEFYGCTGLKNVRIGDGVTTIGDWAFSGCSNLDYFAFGSQMKTIGKEAFSDCINVTKIISRASTPPTCGSQALDDISKWTCELSVPPTSIEAYQAADQWKEFFFINGTSFDEEPKSGDTNHDGVVDVADVMLTVNKAMGKAVANFHEEEADLNQDGEIDVADVMLIVNIMLDNTATRLPAHYREDSFTQLFALENDEGYSLTLDGSNNFTALQMMVTLPEGSVLRNVSLNKENAPFNIRYKSIGDNRYNLVVWSTDGSCLDNTDNFINLLVGGKKSGITVTDIRLTNENFETIILTGTDGTPTSITNFTKDVTDAPIFNLQGVKAANPQKGVYIKNGRKVVIK